MESKHNPAALVVGGTRGIGRETARLLAARGWTVVVSGRDPAVGAATAAELGPRVEFVAADVSRPAETARLADRVREAAPGLRAVVHCADVLRTRRADTPEGIEVAFATNFLSRVQLNDALLDLLRTNAPARIVHVAAAGMPGRLTLDQVPPAPGASAVAAHNTGQRANDVYGVELAARLAGTGVGVAVLNPGNVGTDIRRRMVAGPLARTALGVVELVARPWTTSPARCAERVVRLATDGDLRGGPLFSPALRPKPPRPAVADPGARAALWARAHELVGAAVPDARRPTGAGPA